LLVRVSIYKSLRVVLITFTSTLEAKDQCLGLWSQKVKDAQVEGEEIKRTRGKGFKVLQWQGLENRTLGKRGSLRCCLSKASCSLLLPGKWLAQRQAKSRQESLKRESVAKARFFHQTLKEKMALGVDNLGPGRPLSLEI
jgi:hypothetical protein